MKSAIARPAEARSILPARGSEHEARNFAKLQALACGPSVELRFGRSHARTLAALFSRPFGEHSSDRVFFVHDSERIAGMMIAYQGSDHGLRSQSTRTALKEELGVLERAVAGVFAWMQRLRSVQLGPSAPTDLYIASLAVEESSRHHGIGAELVSYAEKLARSAKNPRLSLDVDALNTEAIAFYEALGFSVDTSPRPGARVLKMVRPVHPEVP